MTLLSNLCFDLTSEKTCSSGGVRPEMLVTMAKGEGGSEAQLTRGSKVPYTHTHKP